MLPLCSLVVEGNVEVEPITDLVQSHIPTATMTRFHGKEVDYTLPLDSVQKFAGKKISPV